LKLRGSLQAPLPLDARPPFPGIGATIGLRAVTAIRGEAHPGKNAAVVSFESRTVEGAQGVHERHAALSEFAPVEQIVLPLEPSTVEIDSMLARIGEDNPIVLMRRAHVYPQQKIAIQRILNAHPDALLVSLREPFDAFEFPAARNVLCTYGDDAPSIAGLAAVLSGGAAAGTLPIHGLPVARG
jgi:hypothetical protein